MLQQLSSNPKNIFLFDAVGALLSAFLLGIVLTTFESYFGMPRKALYFLAFLPCLFAIYDFLCYFRFPKNWRPFLKAIAIINLGYCIISLGFLTQHYQELTLLGWIYFIGELIIVAAIAVFEWRVASE